MTLKHLDQQLGGGSDPSALPAVAYNYLRLVYIGPGCKAMEPLNAV